MCPHPNHPPPHPIPPGCLRAPALSVLFHHLNLHWSSVLHMIIYMFQCCFSNPTLTFSHTVQKSVLYVCLFCCLAYRVITTTFLNFIYMHYTALVFLFLTSLCIMASSTSLELTQCVLFYSWVMSHGVSVPQLPYAFACWWTSRLLPCPSYCK